MDDSVRRSRKSEFIGWHIRYKAVRQKNASSSGALADVAPRCDAGWVMAMRSHRRGRFAMSRLR